MTIIKLYIRYTSFLSWPTTLQDDFMVLNYILQSYDTVSFYIYTSDWL